MKPRVKRLFHIMPKLLTLSQFQVSRPLQYLLLHFVLHMQACNYIMIENRKMLTIFQVKFKRTNQNYSPSNISQSINIKCFICDREVTNISTLHQ